jgi:hypothetical protein
VAAGADGEFHTFRFEVGLEFASPRAGVAEEEGGSFREKEEALCLCGGHGEVEII